MFDASRCPLRLLALSLGTLASLACGGLLDPNQGETPRIRPNPDADDLAERARLQREYQRAEAILKARIRENPDDHHAHRLLGDVNLTRGQDYRKRWKENLARAFDSYRRAVELAPDDCSYWARLAGTVTMAYPNEVTRIPGSTLASLPLEEGWARCPGAALVEIELRRDPDPGALEAWTEANPRKGEIERILELQPWVKAAWERAPISHVDWVEASEPVPVRPGMPFVVVEPPVQARGVGHDYHRPVNTVERFVASRIRADRVIFTDRRFPKKLPREAVVKAPACKFSSWRNNPVTGVATGMCSKGPFVRGKSALYDPSRLEVAGPGHYEFTSIAPAQIPGDEVLWDSVRCLGGPVQRKFEHTPTCPVAYDKPNWLPRSLPVKAVRGARSDAHADQLVRAASMRPVWGEELTERMLRGDIGVGMPYSVFRYALEDLRGCRGRALLARHMINGGQLEWTCLIDDRAYTFVDLQLTWFGTKEAYEASMQRALATSGEE